MIQTVWGPIEQAQLGVTMAHEHLILDLSPVRGETDSRLDDVAYACEAVMDYKALGGQGIVEVTGKDMGRNVKKLKDIAELTGIHIVAATGFYLREYHPSWLEKAAISQIQEIFLKEIQEGIEDTGIKAGIIGEVATSFNKMYPTEEKVLRAAARAALETKVAVTTHCDGGTMANVQCNLLLEEGMAPNKIILGHLDLLDNLATYEALLQKGVTLGFDTIGKTAYKSDEIRANHVATLVQKGFAKQIILSQDVSRKSYYKAYGGGGYTQVLKDFVPRLKAKGISEDELNLLLVENPASVLNKD